MKLQVRASLALSVMAIIAALGGVGGAIAGSMITGKQIRNGSLTSLDYHKGSVKSTDIANSSVSTADIGTDQVTPADVAMPAPESNSAGGTAAKVGGEFAPLQTILTGTKDQAESVLHATWGGTITASNLTTCIFQLRVNGQPPTGGGGEAAASSEQVVQINVDAVFAGIPAGPVSVEIWAKVTQDVYGTSTCQTAPANPGIRTTATISEDVV